jgi:hypothetical protein
MQHAIRNGAVSAGEVALALMKVGDYGGPSILDERDEARAEVERMRPVVEAAREWRGSLDHSKALCAAVDLYLAAVTPPSEGTLTTEVLEKAFGPTSRAAVEE